MQVRAAWLLLSRVADTGAFWFICYILLWREIKRYQLCLLTCCWFFPWDCPFRVTCQQSVSAATVAVVLRLPPPRSPSTWEVLPSPFSALGPPFVQDFPSLCLKSICLMVSHFPVSLPSSHQHNCVKSSWALPHGVHLRIPMPASSVDVYGVPLRRSAGGGGCLHLHFSLIRTQRPVTTCWCVQ